jgi:hypothetical protein
MTDKPSEHALKGAETIVVTDRDRLAEPKAREITLLEGIGYLWCWAVHRRHHKCIRIRCGKRGTTFGDYICQRCGRFGSWVIHERG